MAQESQKRHIAFKISLSYISDSEFVKGEGWDPSYIVVGEKKVSRVDVIAVVISKEGSSFVIDDSVSQIACRYFDANEEFERIGIGSIVHIIGKPREYNNERYILPEIAKIISKEWFDLRQKELVILSKVYGDSGPSSHKGSQNQDSSHQKGPAGDSSQQVSEEAVEEVIDGSTSSGSKENVAGPQAIVSMIRQLDKGNGVSVDDIASSSSIKDYERMIDYLLKEGEIFEIMPGRLKVLE